MDQIFGRQWIEIPDSIMYKIMGAMIYLLQNIIDFVDKNVTFRSGSCFTPKAYIRDSGVIFLNETDSLDTILHEIAHAYLRHRIDLETEEENGEPRVKKEVNPTYLLYH